MRSTLFLLALVACTDVGREQAPADAPAPSAVAPEQLDTTSRAIDGEYVLAAIGPNPLSDALQPKECFQIPRWSLYRLTRSRWVAIDSGRTAPVCVPPAAFVVRSDSGYFRMAGDTVLFYVADSTIGERGLVLAGLARNDTLLLWGADLDPGDFVYLRRRP
jgi:hypothetical protein